MIATAYLQRTFVIISTYLDTELESNIGIASDAFNITQSD